jgi:alkanesulfonate monooxygenase SsuD/methylene tetrahydromethanopterin reductase-like flavin-dependent oxidoreductase (luciferase family)
VFAADTDDEAQRLFTSVQQAFVNLVRGTPGRLPPPATDIEGRWTPAEKAQVSARLACSVVGAPETVRRGLTDFIDRTGVDEVIVAASIYDHAARLRSYEIVAELFCRPRRPGDAVMLSGPGSAVSTSRTR